jgi:hypothetical protein
MVCLSFSFISVLVLLLLLLLINLSFILIIIYLYFFFSYFQIFLIVLYFGVIPSSKINNCLKSTIGQSGGASLGFNDKNSWFKCNGKVSGYFLKGWRLNYVIQFFFHFYLILIFILFLLDVHMYLKILT